MDVLSLVLVLVLLPQWKKVEEQRAEEQGPGWK
jgi:hypothetical protein